MMLKTISVGVFFSLLLLLPMSPRSDGEEYQKQWCIADPQTPDEVLQPALDWACGEGGANCSMIQVNQPCNLPNTTCAHASYAFNSYWQRSRSTGGSCYFSAAAIVTETDPSHDLCQYVCLT